MSIFIFLKTDNQPFKWRKWLINTSLIITVLVIAVIPWSLALQAKYGKGFTISTAGTFNQTWVLSPAYPQPVELIQVPHYEDDYSFWDDPSYWNIKNINPFTNKAVFLFQLKMIVTNVLDSIKVFNDFSFLAIAVLLAACMLALTGNRLFVLNKNNLVLLAFLFIFPAGYIILHVEARFFWIMDIILVIFAGIILSILQQSGYLKNRLFTIVSIIVFGSFCIYPANQLQDQYNQGRDVFVMADAFKKNNIQGRIISNFSGYEEQARSAALCFLLNSQNYGPGNPSHTETEILQAIKEYKIDHYIMYYHLPMQKEMILSSTLARNALRVRDDIYPGLIVLTFR